MGKQIVFIAWACLPTGRCSAFSERTRSKTAESGDPIWMRCQHSCHSRIGPCRTHPYRVTMWVRGRDNDLVLSENAPHHMLLRSYEFAAYARRMACRCNGLPQMPCNAADAVKSALPACWVVLSRRSSKSEVGS